MASVKLNKQFYSFRAIQQTIKAYGHLAKISMHQVKGYYNIKFSRIAAGLKDILKYEFSNYALVLSKNDR